MAQQAGAAAAALLCTLLPHPLLPLTSQLPSCRNPEEIVRLLGSSLAHLAVRDTRRAVCMRGRPVHYRAMHASQE